MHWVDISGIITDKTSLQFRMLNKSKGPAMWSPRAQSDRMRFAEEWRLALEKNSKRRLLARHGKFFIGEEQYGFAA